MFTPTRAEMYPAGEPMVRVDAGHLGDRLEGASRPGHFSGVLTVVLKLLHLTRPDAAVFGDKDAQQLALIRAMVRDLDLGVEIVGIPTIREPDGLALSSRNHYLSAPQRETAPALSRALRAAVDAAAAGPSGVRDAARGVLEATSGVVVDYVEVVDDETWMPANDQTTRGRLLLAARIGTTRLIDNVSVHLGTRAVSADTTSIDSVG